MIKFFCFFMAAMFTKLKKLCSPINRDDACFCLPALFFLSQYILNSCAKKYFQGASTLDNVDEWKWKFHMLLRNDNEQEIISRERKDRRDFEQLAQLADRMGLHRYFSAALIS